MARRPDVLVRPPLILFISGGRQPADQLSDLIECQRYALFVAARQIVRERVVFRQISLPGRIDPGKDGAERVALQSVRPAMLRTADRIPATSEPKTTAVTAQSSSMNARAFHFGSRLTRSDAPASTDPSGPHNRRGPSRRRCRPIAARHRRRPCGFRQRHLPNDTASSGR